MDEVEAEVRRIVDLVSDGNDAEAASLAPRIAPSDIGRALREYGGTFVRPPADHAKVVSIVSLAVIGVEGWSTWAPLWTLEEGRSDLDSR